MKTPLAPRFPESIRTGAETLLASVRSDASQDRVKLDAVLAEVQKLEGQVQARTIDLQQHQGGLFVVSPARLPGR